MEHFFTIASLWLALAVLSVIIAYHLRISIALVEISVGVLVAALATSLGKTDSLGFNQEWLRFLASSGAVLLTFLAGEFTPHLHHGLVKEGLQKIAGKFSSERDFGPRSVADFEGIDDPAEKERIQRDAYERVNALFKKLGIEQKGTFTKLLPS